MRIVSVSDIPEISYIHIKNYIELIQHPINNSDVYHLVYCIINLIRNE